MKFIPASLFGRFVIMILTPIILLQVIASIVFYERHWDNVRYHMQDTIIREILFILNGYESSTNEREFNQFLHTITPLTVQVSYQIATPYPFNQMRSLDRSDTRLDSFRHQLESFLQEDFNVYYIADNRKVRVQIFTSKSELLFDFPNKKISSPTTYIYVLWIVISGILLVFISLLFMKNQVRSIAAIAVAAEKLGKGQHVPKIKATGAAEIKKLALAFSRMQHRIERQITYRTELLAHLSHDIRTPLTRIKLQLAVLEDIDNQHEINEINIDLKEMEEMLARHIEIAKGDGNELSEQQEIIALIKDVIARYKDTRIKFHCLINKLYMFVKKESIKRAMQNIIDNAIKYANKKIIIRVKQQVEHLIIQIDDDGPGIPSDKINLAFKPFAKLDSESSGFGLGLAIVRNIVTNHGGDIKLARSSKGGLMVYIKLPL
jgi:two-component system osmolarity sensor histidine kinase EnvZ